MAKLKIAYSDAMMLLDRRGNVDEERVKQLEAAMDATPIADEVPPEEY